MEQEIQKLIEELGDNSTHTRKSAREKLINIGFEIIDDIILLLDHQKHTYRWEAMKILEEIGDPVAIPIFIEYLEDDESDIRWIAAEGLTRLGPLSIKPLLKRLVENPNHSISLFLGVHQVFNRFKRKKLFKEQDQIDDFLKALKKHKATGDIKSYALKILSRIESEEV